MGVVAMLIIRPERPFMRPGRQFEQFLVPLTPGGYISNLITIDQVVAQEKSFEIVDGRQCVNY